MNLYKITTRHRAKSSADEYLINADRYEYYSHAYHFYTGVNITHSFASRYTIVEKQ